MVLTNFDSDPLLDLDPWVGQRSATYRFDRVNGVTGQVMGEIHPIRGAALTHDTDRTIKRELTIALGVEDMEAVNTVQDRILPYMVFPNGQEYPLGRYMFTDASRQVFTSGRLGNLVLNDEMFLVDQKLTKGINGVGFGVSKVIEDVLIGLPITYRIEGSPYTSAEAWSIGTNRGSILDSLSVTGDYFPPWFDNNGILQFIRTFNPADKIPDFNLDSGRQVMRTPILEQDDLLTAPNIFIVVSNNSSTPAVEIIGRAAVPATAPHSFANRGFEIPDVQDLQVTDAGQAQAVANGLMNRQTIFERVTMDLAPDPRYDSYNVVFWQGDLWLDLSWSLTLVEGSPMTHTFRRAYAGIGVAEGTGEELT